MMCIHLDVNYEQYINIDNHVLPCIPMYCNVLPNIVMYCHVLQCIASLSTLICEVEHIEQSLHSDPIQRSLRLRAFDCRSFAIAKILSSLATRSI